MSRTLSFCDSCFDDALTDPPEKMYQNSPLLSRAVPETAYQEEPLYDNMLQTKHDQDEPLYANVVTQDLTQVDTGLYFLSNTSRHRSLFLV